MAYLLLEVKIKTSLPNRNGFVLDRGRITWYSLSVCGRFIVSNPKAILQEVLGEHERSEIEARYNVTPGQTSSVVTVGENDSRCLTEMQWGLVPSWVSQPTTGHRMINARVETVGEKPAFRESVAHRRCVVPADGFYEWQKSAEGKQPYLLRLNTGTPFGFAGLWDCWRGSDGHVLETFTILTTVANALVEPIHKRMPVILDRQQREAWLLPWTGPEGIHQFCEPFPASAMETIPVSDYVNNPAHDSVECVQAVPLPDRQTLF